MPVDTGSHEGPQQALLRLLVKQSSCVHASHPALPYKRQSMVRGDGGQAFGVRWNLHPVQIHYLSSQTLDTLSVGKTFPVYLVCWRSPGLPSASVTW